MSVNTHPMPAFDYPDYQVRMARLQVFNWGIFNGLHTMPISAKGHLICGPSGSGKSTLNDGITVLTTPSKFFTLNDAAIESSAKGGKRGDRTVMSYVRGAWSSKEGEEAVETEYLRSESTWSALGLVYRDGKGRAFTIAQLLWIKGTGRRSEDVKRLYFVFPREFDLTELAQHEIDTRVLKRAFAGHVEDDFPAYMQQFMPLLNIRSESDLKLLHKTQSAKNLDNLNNFLRDFVLEEPVTFQLADALVKEFVELNLAHEAVAKATLQVKCLAPAKEAWDLRNQKKFEAVELDAVLMAMPAYESEQRIRILKDRLGERDQTLQEAFGQIERARNGAQLLQQAYRAIDQEYASKGGNQISDQQTKLKEWEEQVQKRTGARVRATRDFTAVGWKMPNSIAEFARYPGEARHQQEQAAEASVEHQNKRGELLVRQRELGQELQAVTREVEAMRTRKSNIRSVLLDLRSLICLQTGISEADMPFAGEVMEVAKQKNATGQMIESPWRGAIERVLRPFANAMLVPERHYDTVNKYLDETDIKRRIVYFKTTQRREPDTRPLPVKSLIRKLDVKAPAEMQRWIEAELKDRYDYVCAESRDEFRDTKKAVLISGLIRSGDRNEKDDHSSINNQAEWSTGFDNTPRRLAYEAKAQALGAQISEVMTNVRAMDDQSRTELARQNILHWIATLTDYTDFDVEAAVQAVDQIAKTILSLKSKSKELGEVEERMNKAFDEWQKANQAVSDKEGRRNELKRQQEADESDLEATLNKPPILPMSVVVREAIAARYSDATKTLVLENLERIGRQVERKISEDQAEVKEVISKQEQIAMSKFTEFLTRWAADMSGNLDASVQSAPEFLTKLEELRNDDLPRYEEKFLKLLQSTSRDNLSMLTQQMAEAVRGFTERIEDVNAALHLADFNGPSVEAPNGSFLFLRIIPEPPPQREEFKKLADTVLRNSLAPSMTREEADEKFAALNMIVKRLSSQEHRDWRLRVLDVRKHVGFRAHEVNRAKYIEGEDIVKDMVMEVFEGSSGKSGGQRQKLACTCLAAALRYRFSEDGTSAPAYASILMDEAFSKSDTAFTELAMEVFERFGFAVTVMTPMKNVMALERFMNSATFVQNIGRNNASLMMIPYDTANKRLLLPKPAMVAIETEREDEAAG